MFRTILLPILTLIGGKGGKCCFKINVWVSEINSISGKLSQCYHFPTVNQYGEFIIGSKSFHQNDNISETVA